MVIKPKRALSRLGSTCWTLLRFLVLLGPAFGKPALLQSQPHRPPWSSEVVDSKVLRSGGASIQVDFGPGKFDLPREQLLAWVQMVADTVSGYYGRFPVTSARILIQPVSGEHGVVQGTTWGNVGGFPAFTRLRLGEQTTGDDLKQDWTLTHELVHTGFPSMADNHHWIEEGIATYVEPIARVQRGLLQPEQIWGDMVRDMPKGEPAAGDRGLDLTHTWGRTYWGGALFCLVADVTIRERTGNRKGLQDALRAIVAAGGTIDQEWSLERALSEGDKATGTTVLLDLYHQMATTPQPVDLDKLWQKLGVSLVDGGVHFDGHAPEAAIREAIARKPLH